MKKVKKQGSKKHKTQILKNSHSLYKFKIGHLAYKTSRGDIVSEVKLKRELSKNPAARAILKKILDSKTLYKYAPKTKFQGMYAMSRPESGNIFKMWGAGAPGLGRFS
ncbi:hypothetical protein ABMX80_21280 [Vibrio vulnificus]|uniref:hypothetical protein n=1 Tax=Vibrio TaxID=662 RepID=UPI00237CD445|nr:hypothetical protein [Vibrio aestuarianus]MDE1251272.1 hypothetical protein [Vibrio aestuarianus]MDE1255088.1 hypothetical protein [Vibrio aestuarianus]